jgi:glycosyltransferase involved in cell wall biosynthesis
MDSTGISVIICTHNGSNRIIPTLEAIAQQNLPQGLICELIIVDNASNDNTSEIARRYWNSIHPRFSIKILSEQEPGKANALMRGYSEAQYELMLVCDDDNWLQPDYLKVVCELYMKYPDIGLLGGYGIAEFRNEERPSWFDKWEKCYACGKHHSENGFLEPGDHSIWGAGSVIRKTMWTFLRENGFHFINSTGRGKPMGEDTEISHVIMYSGQKLYFDDRLWFRHDLSGGRITWPNFLEQMKTNGKASALFIIYYMISKNFRSGKFHFNQSLSVRMIFLVISLVLSVLKRRNKPWTIYFYSQLMELMTKRKEYRAIYEDIHHWLGKIINSYPLKPIQQ